MSYLPPEKKDPNKVSSSRMIIWIIVSCVGLYLVGSGVIGIINGGS